MRNFFICCSDCYDRIESHGTSFAEAWVRLCKMRMESKEWIAFNRDLLEFEILEEMGFLVSTEYEDVILVKLNGYTKTEDNEDFFCVCSEWDDEDD